MADLGTAFIRIMPDTTGLNTRLGAYFSGSQFGKLGKAAGVALGAGLAAGGAVKGLYEIGQAFDDASDKIRVRTGANEKELAKLEKSFKNVVSGVPADFDSASTAVADLNQRLGLSGKPLQRLSKQMLELSRITETDVGTNIESVSKAFRDWEVRTKDQSKTLDAFFRLSQKSGVSVADLATSVQQFGSPLRQLGFTLDESAAMFANFERSGVNTQTMVPGLKLAISNLTRPTDELGASMEKLGVNVGKPDVALRQVFDLMSEKGLPTVEKTGLAMDVFGKRAGADMAEAIKQGRFEVDDLLKVMEDGTETIRKAGRETMDFGEQWQKLKNNVFVALEPVAKRVFGALGDEMKRVTDILTDKKLSKEEKFTAILKRIEEVVAKAVPKMAEAGAKLGISLAKGIANAFLDSSILGKLFIGAAVFKLFGGKALISAGGKSMGKVLGRGMVVGVLLALPLLLPEAWKLGKKIGEKISNAMGPPITKAINALKAKFEDLMDTLTNSEQFDIQDVGGLKAATARLIEKYGTDLESVIADLAKVGVGRERAGNAIMRALRDQDLPKIDTKGAEKSFDRIDERAKQSGKGWDRYSEGVGKNAQKAMGSTDRHADRSRDDLKRIDDALGKTRGVTDKYAQGADKNFGKVTTESGRMEQGVSRNVGGMVNLVGKGLKIFASNTNKALQGFGAKEKISLALETVGGAAIGKQRGGYINQGAPSGDSVPAMLERKEYVVNRKAREGMESHYGPGFLDAWNFGIAPRGMQAGGLAGLQPGITRLAKYAADRYGLRISSGLRPGTGSLHNIGEAVDLVPPGMAATEGIFAAFKSQLAELFYDPWGGFDEGTMIGAIGGHMDHIHAAIHGAGTGGPGAIVKKIKRLLLKGPDGPPKDLGQAGLDKAWKAATKYVSAQMPSHGNLGIGDVSGPLQAIAKRMITERWGAGQWPPFDELVMRESGWDPSAVNPSSGAAGLAQALPPSKYPAGAWPYTGKESAVKQLQWMVSYVAERYGSPAGAISWHDAHNWYQKGGLVQMLAGGGGADTRKKPKKDKTTPRGADDVWEQLRPGSKFGDPIRGSNALQAALKAQKKLGRLGRAIAIQDELIDRTDRLASLESGPAGSELSLGERDSLIGLNTTLLRKLAATGALSAQGLTLTERGMKNASGSTLSRLKGLQGAFKESQVEALGLTGRSGRLFDTKLALDDLRNTATAGATGLDISALRSILEFNRFGGFEGMFGEGGTLKAGEWGIAGERGRPEVVTGPATVHSPQRSEQMLGGPLKMEVTAPIVLVTEDGREVAREVVTFEMQRRDRSEHHRRLQGVR